MNLLYFLKNGKSYLNSFLVAELFKCSKMEQKALVFPIPKQSQQPTWISVEVYPIAHNNSLRLIVRIKLPQICFEPG